MYNLNFNQLYYFYVVATIGSIKEACDILHLTQPSVSGGIKSLEDSLGVKLFNREYRKLTLNKNGKKIYEKTKRIFCLGEELLNDLKVENFIENSNLNIGISKSIPQNISIEIIESILKEKSIKINFEYCEQEKLNEIINKNDYDLVFAMEDEDFSTTYKVNEVLSVKHLVLSKTNSSFTSLNLESTLKLRPCLTIGHVKQNILKNINHIGRINDHSVLEQSVLRGDRIAICDEFSANLLLKSNEICCVGILPEAEYKILGISNGFSRKKVLIKKVLDQTNFNFLNETNLRKCI